MKNVAKIRIVFIVMMPVTIVVNASLLIKEMASLAQLKLQFKTNKHANKNSAVIRVLVVFTTSIGNKAFVNALTDMKVMADSAP